MHAQPASTRLDVTTIEDASSGIRRALVIQPNGDYAECIEMSDPERDPMRLEPRTLYVMDLPERGR